GGNMGVEGEDTPGVVDGVDFLRKVSLGEKVNVGDRVMVVGGGNVAIDAARTAIRLGAKDVSIVYRRARAEMPASDEEIEEALDEGINLNVLMNPSKVTPATSGKVKVEFIRMALGKIDESGRRRPVPIEGSNFTEEYDLMIKAVGQESVIPGGFGLEAGRGGRIAVNADTLATSKSGVYAGGDVVSGPASVVEAIADGKQAAKSIDRYLGGDGKIEEALAPPETVIVPVDKAKLEGEKYRLPMRMAPAKERIKSFAQVVLGYDEDKATEEAERCLRCDLEAR
ncbi:MAG: FAD-dependent oxidoreductase, partial [Chloroflexi bacterium]|nr:FAD-dependent oxidoreductase [Chloroflexota bacterium]